MNRKTLTECLKMYPRISEEIAWQEDNLKYYEGRKKELVENGLKEVCSDIMAALEKALELTKLELKDLYETKKKVDSALIWMNTKQKQIVQMRLWDSKPKTWGQIAKVFNCHRSTIEREYKKVIDSMLNR